MPTIPTYDRQISQTVAPTVRANENSNIESFGGGQALREEIGTAQGIVKQSQDLFTQQKRAADDAVGQSIYSFAASKKNDLLYNPQTGALGQKGENALTVGQVYGDQFNKDIDDYIEKHAVNDEQRAQGRMFKAKFGAELNDSLTKHTFNESQNLRDTFAKEALDAAAEDIKLNFQNPGKLEEGIELQRNISMNNLAQKGIYGDLATEMTHKVLSNSYHGVVDRLITMGDASGAKAKFDGLVAEGKLTSADRDNLAGTLKVAVLNNESMHAADDIFSKYAGNRGGALSAVDQMFPDDADKRAKTRDLVRQKFSDIEDTQKYNDTQNFRTAIEIAEKSQGRDPLPAKTEAALQASGKMDDYRKYVKVLLSGEDPPPQSARYFELHRMMLNEPDKFKKMEFEFEKGKISKSEISFYQERQSNMISGKEDDELKGALTTQQYLATRARDMGIDPTPKEGSRDAHRMRTLQQSIENSQLEFKQRNGRAADAQERKKIVDDNFYESIKGGWFSKPKLSGEVSFSDIPKDMLPGIANEVKRRGISLTDPRAESMMVNIFLNTTKGPR